MRFWILTLLLVCLFQENEALLSPLCGDIIHTRRCSIGHSSSPLLHMSGDGIANDYTWHEEAFELEVSVQVPPETRAKDIYFKATTHSIELRLQRPDQNDSILLLDPERPLRGRVSVEGTFWIISDPNPSSLHHRLVTVTIEKIIRTPKDDFDVIDYDWKGLYLQEEPNEVSFRKYDEAEELNVREYAASLGVDIDNLNMSLVDKTMFTSGLNLTQSSLDSLKEAGLMKEITQQGDGSEWTTDENGEQIPFPSILAGINQTRPTIPFLDTNSPWHKAIPLTETENLADAATTTSTTITPETKADTTTNQDQKQRAQKITQLQNQRKQRATDPIETLTVARLKEILKSRGLKVTGNKKELQDRLRAEVSSLMTTDEDTEGQ